MKYLVCFLALISSCSTLAPKNIKEANRVSSRGVSSIELGGLVLLDKTQSIIDMVAEREINPGSCLKELDSLIGDYKSLTPQNLDLSTMKADGQKILDQSFEARLALHTLLVTLPNECKLKLKELNLLMRLSEDYVGVHHYSDEQVSSDTIKFPEEATPIFERDAYHPYHVGMGIDPLAKFEFQNGDVMITKGVSFVSSTISEIAQPRSLFSHIVFVHVDKETKVASTIEAYVGKGVGIYTIDEALKNENARIVVLRAKDSELAGKAADYMFKKVTELKKKQKVIPYDYDLNFEDNTKLSCEEVAFDAFKQVSDGKFIVPEVMSTITMEDASFLKRIGIKKGNMMVPTDMETDSRFNVVLDWTDYRLVRDSWRKDAILGEMFHWINKNDYSIHENLTSTAAKIVWSTRNTVLWPMMAKIAGLSKDLMNDIPSITITTMASLKTIGGILYPEVTKADQMHYAKFGKWMSSEMLRESLDKFRETEPKDLKKVFRARKK